MSALKKLVEISSPATGGPHDGGIPSELASLLAKRNGFFSFEGALEVFPNGWSAASYSLSEWNNESLWRGCYPNLAQVGLCFAQDAFGNQFVWKDRTLILDPETGRLEDFAPTLESWAQKILRDYNFLTGYAVAREWQISNGPIPPKSRLVPLTPFILGGEYEPDNLISMDSAKSLKIRAILAKQVAQADDGSQIVFDIRNQ